MAEKKKSESGFSLSLNLRVEGRSPPAPWFVAIVLAVLTSPFLWWLLSFLVGGVG